MLRTGLEISDTQVPINMSVFATRLKNAAWRVKPSWAVIATDDKAFDQRMLQTMAKRIGHRAKRSQSCKAQRIDDEQ